MNNTMQPRNCRHRNRDSQGQSQSTRAMLATFGVVGRVGDPARRAPATDEVICVVYGVLTMRSIVKRVQRLQTLIPPIPPPKPQTEEDKKFAETVITLL